MSEEIPPDIPYYPRPGFVVQMGDTVTRTSAGGAVTVENIGWDFHSAHFNDWDALEEAAGLSLRNPYVRVVTRAEAGLA